MEWTQVFTIIGVLGGFIFYMIQRLEKDFDKTNKSIEVLSGRLDGHATRIDQLYRMFVDLLKEGRK